MRDIGPILKVVSLPIHGPHYTAHRKTELAINLETHDGSLLM